jgi:hypothetical protein
MFRAHPQDSGYYRHRNVCQEFVDARPPMARHGRGQSAGHAYPMDLYEQVVEGILAEAALAAPTLASVVGALVPSSARRDDAALARIAREREVALARYVRDRDSAVLDATMRALDADEARALQPREEEGVPADEAVRYLRELPETWAKARGGTGRAMVADALFERIDVLGLREATAHLTTDAVRHGLAAALPKEFGILVRGRGERNCVVMSDAGAVVRFVRATLAREHAHTA